MSFFYSLKKPQNTHVIANQSADWCGDPLHLREMFEIQGDCHVGLRPPRNDVVY